MEKILKSAGYKITPARLAILDILYGSKKPLDAEHILNCLKKTVTGRKINDVTVYRTLSSFESSRIIRKVFLKKDSAHFELSERHHHHIVCDNCDKIEDFENKEVENLLKRIVAKSAKFKKITEHSFELFGICKACSQGI